MGSRLNRLVPQSGDAAFYNCAQIGYFFCVNLICFRTGKDLIIKLLHPCIKSI